jgi:multisubunit Na+/H+ antiporter MnhE subunit
MELAAWWAATLGVWMLSLSAYSRQDLVVAAFCALGCAAMAVLARRAVRGAWLPPPAALRWLVVLPWSIAVDTVRVLTLPWRPARRSTEGEFRTVSLGAQGETAAAAGRRAVASVVLSSTPGAYVVETDHRSGTALVHSLTPPSLVERRVAG